MKKYYLMLYIFIVCLNSIYAINKIDSLKVLLKNADSDIQKIEINIKIADEYKNTNPDSADSWYNKVIRISRNNLNKNYKFKIYHANALSQLSFIYAINFANFDTAILFLNQALHTLQSIDINNKEVDSNYVKRNFASAYNNFAIVYHFQGNNEKAIEFFLKTIRIYEELEYKDGLAGVYNNIAVLHKRQKNYDKTLEYLNKALNISIQLEKKDVIRSINNNLGNVYADKNQYNKAIECYLKFLDLSIELNNSKSIADAYMNLGIVYNETKEYSLSLDYLKKSLEMYKSTNDKISLSNTLENLSYLYLNKSSVATGIEREKLLQEAVKYGIQAHKISEEIGAVSNIKAACNRLYKAYENLGDYKNALKYAKQYIETQDSMFNEEKTRALADMETKYESEKKQQEIEKQKILIEKKDVEMKKRNLQRNAFIGGFIFMGLLAFIVFRSYRQKKVANVLISEKNNKLEKANIEISEQKEQIEKIHKSLTDSIDYALRIQKAALPTDDTLKSCLKQYFLLYRPKHVVSGDFYWITTVNSWTIIAVADCTGHGVPGAFMSMLGISYLDEIVKKKKITNAAEILNHLRSSIIEALKQKGQANEAKDGMDISIASINKEKKLCYWAGANNPLYIIKNKSIRQLEVDKQLNDHDNIVEVIKGDKMPVAIHTNLNKFTNHEIQLEKGDRSYLFSDGFPDQFGGENGMKYKYKPFRALLAQTATLKLPSQGEEIEYNLDKWMQYNNNKYQQIDDITILGFEFS